MSDIEVECIYRCTLGFHWDTHWPKGSTKSKDELVFDRTRILDGVDTTMTGHGPCWYAYVVIEANTPELVKAQANLFLREIKRWKDYHLE